MGSLVNRANRGRQPTRMRLRTSSLKGTLNLRSLINVAKSRLLMSYTSIPHRSSRNSGRRSCSLTLNTLMVSSFRFRNFFLILTLLRTEQVKKANPDMTVLKEYKQREQEFLNRAQDLENITAQRDSQKATYDGLRKLRLDEFMAGFNLISLKLKEMYQVCAIRSSLVVCRLTRFSSR